MSENDDFFAPPPFSAESALQSVRRELRALGLAEREGRFERRGARAPTVAHPRMDRATRDECRAGARLPRRTQTPAVELERHR
ncbi:hypothetical protein ABXN37_05145 [Piscinibacter sakaiensis]|uniref:hypothetical protein n=1 Tax=Piscinibacter sakaiensis TaxID=1547922 RepID=UPI0037289861